MLLKNSKVEDKATVKQITKFLRYNKKSRGLNSNTVSPQNFRILTTWFALDYIQNKIDEYMPKPLLAFLNYFLKEPENGTRLIAEDFEPTFLDLQQIEYILSSENYRDVFEYNRPLQQYLAIKYPSETFQKPIKRNKRSRQSSVSHFSFIGRRGSYESFDAARVQYIYLLSLSMFSRNQVDSKTKKKKKNQELFADSDSEGEAEKRAKAFRNNQLLSDIEEIGFCSKNNSTACIVLTSYNFKEALVNHPFPNKLYQAIFKDYKRSIAIPGTVSMLKLTDFEEGDSIFDNILLRDVYSYFIEYLYMQDIHRNRLVEHFNSKLSSADIFKLFTG